MCTPPPNKAPHRFEGLHLTAPVSSWVLGFGLTATLAVTLGAGCGPGLEPPAKAPAFPTSEPNGGRTGTGGLQGSPEFSGGTAAPPEAIAADAGILSGPEQDGVLDIADGGQPMEQDGGASPGDATVPADGGVQASTSIEDASALGE